MSTATLTKTPIPTGTWNVDPAHTRVGFAVKHLGLATVRGEFREFEGAIEIGDDLADAKAYGTVKAASIDTNQPQRDEHLRSEDFFGAEANPVLRFESTRIEQTGEGEFEIAGDLTMNGVTNEVELLAEVTGVGTGPQGEDRVGLEVTGQISRRDYAMRFNAVAGSGNAVVGDKVKLALDVSVIREA